MTRWIVLDYIRWNMIFVKFVVAHRQVGRAAPRSRLHLHPSIYMGARCTVISINCCASRDRPIAFTAAGLMCVSVGTQLRTSESSWEQNLMDIVTRHGIC